MSLPAPEQLSDFVDGPLKSKLDANCEVRASRRRRTQLFTAVYLIIAVPITAAATGAMGLGTDDGLWTTYRGAFALVAGWIVLYAVLWKRYVSRQIPFEYVEDVVTPLIHYINPRLDVRRDEKFRASELERLPLFFDRIDEVASGPLFTGSAGGVKLKFGSVRFDAAAGDSEAYGSFEGLVLSAELNRKFEGCTVISPHRADTDLAGLGVEDSALKPVELQWESAREHLQVLSTAPDCTEQWLSRPVADALVDICEQVGESSSHHPNWPSTFAVAVSGTTVAAVRPADAYFQRSASTEPTDTSHLHRVGAESYAFMSLVYRL